MKFIWEVKSYDKKGRHTLTTVHADDLSRDMEIEAIKKLGYTYEVTYIGKR